jgi:hypothetical protein
MRRFATYIVLFLLSLAGLKAQFPGIQGRKFVVAAMGTMAPPASQSRLSKDYTTNRVGPVLGYGLQLEYVLSRRHALNLQVTPGTAYYSDDFQEDYMRERSMSVGLKFRTYGFRRSGNLAPIGGFGEIGLAIQRYKSFYYDQIPLEDETPTSIERSVRPYLILGIGRAWLHGRVWGEYGLQLVGSTHLMLYDPEYQSRVARLNALTLRLGIGLLN